MAYLDSNFDGIDEEIMTLFCANNMTSNIQLLTIYGILHPITCVWGGGATAFNSKAMLRRHC